MTIYSIQLLMSGEKYKPEQVILNENLGSGTINILQKGVYKIELVGAGGSTADAWSKYNTTSTDHRECRARAGGGGGGYLAATIILEKGRYDWSCGISTGNMIIKKENGTTVNITGDDGTQTYLKFNNVIIGSADGGTGGYAKAGYSAKTKSATAGKGGGNLILYGNNLKDSITSNSAYIIEIHTKLNGSSGSTDSYRNTVASDTWAMSPCTAKSRYDNKDNGFGASNQNGLIKITYLRKG